jgi:hypothetical protein
VTNKATAAQYEKVTITKAPSKNWNANPYYGSSKSGANPGETKAEVKICGIGGNAAACSTKVGNGTVSATRYKWNGTRFVFSGPSSPGPWSSAPTFPTAAPASYGRANTGRLEGSSR